MSPVSRCVIKMEMYMTTPNNKGQCVQSFACYVNLKHMIY